MNPELFKIGGSWLTTSFVWLAGLIAVFTFVRYKTAIAKFTGEVKVELAKASWPWEPKEKGAKKYKELIDSTIIVLIAMIILSGYIAGWDFIMNIIMTALFRQPKE
jgi:preprotein translocase subunit SecE